MNAFGLYKRCDGYDDGIQKRMGISVSGGDVNYGTKTHLFFR